MLLYKNFLILPYFGAIVYFSLVLNLLFFGAKKSNKRNMARMLLAGRVVVQALSYEQGYHNSNLADRSEYIRADLF